MPNIWQKTVNKDNREDKTLDKNKKKTSFSELCFQWDKKNKEQNALLMPFLYSMRGPLKDKNVCICLCIIHLHET